MIFFFAFWVDKNDKATLRFLYNEGFVDIKVELYRYFYLENGMDQLSECQTYETIGQKIKNCRKKRKQ